MVGPDSYSADRATGSVSGWRICARSAADEGTTEGLAANSCASVVSSAITARDSLPSAAASRRARCQAGVPDGSPPILRSASRQSANTSAGDRCPLGRSDIVATSSSTVVPFADGAALGGGQPKRAPGSFPKPRRQQSGVLPESGRTRPRPNDPTSPGPAPDPRC